MLLLQIRGIAKSFGDKDVLLGVDMDVAQGSRLALVGINGVGKSTLSQIVAGRLTPDAGRLAWLRPTISVGYLDQTHNFSLRTLETEGESQGRFLETASLLGLDRVARWDWEGERTLSGGEKTKLALAKIWAAAPDMLILDEPTNHMDLQSREQLEQTLEQYSGTIILVSHDRYMLERLCERLLVFEDKKITLVPWGFQQWYQQREERKQRPGQKERREQILLIETRMAWLLGQINRFTPEDPEYAPLDQEYLKLAQIKRELS
jgi:macrolide transport system ATP-binding/permease protein